MYLNDHEPYVAHWLRNLFPGAVVDDRSILAVEPGDLVGHRRCHFFAGIGGWEYALQLAGWPETAEVWTGSPPCQALSSARRGRGCAIDLWPAWRPLIDAIRPGTVFIEQVAQAHAWHDRVCDDLEAMDYAIGTAVLPACSVGFDHLRARFYCVGHTHRDSQSISALDGQMARMPRPHRVAGTLERPHGVSPRASQLRAYGNAIVPQVAAEFVMAFMQASRS